MRRGAIGWTRRLAAVVGVSLVTMIVTGPGASAVSVKDLTSYSAFGTGQVLRVKLTLPKAVTQLLNTALAPVGSLTGQALQLPETIDEAVVFTRSVGQLSGAVNGTGLGQIFKGVSDNTLDNTLNSIAQKTFGRVLPVAQAILGKDTGEVKDSLASLDLPSAALKLIHVGVMEVSAESIPHAGIANAAFTKSTSRLLGITIDLGQEIKNLLISTLQPVLNITDGVNGTGGLIDTLNSSLLGTVTQTVKQLTGLDLNLQLPKVADLLSKPLLKIGLIETGSSTDATGIARLASGVSKVADLSIFGNDASDALVHVSSLESKASAKIDGTVGGAAAAAEHTIVGLSVLNNNIAVTNNAIKIANKTIDLPLDVVNNLTDLLGSALGLEIKVLETKTTKSALHSTAEANTLRISLHPTVAGLGDLLGLDIWAPSAQADVAGDIVGASNPGRPSPTTGIPDTAFLLAGPALLGMAVLVRKFALSN